MTDEQGADHHRKEGGQLQGQQRRGEMAQDDRRQESKRPGGEPPHQDAHPDKQSHTEREEAGKRRGGPA